MFLSFKHVVVYKLYVQYILNYNYKKKQLQIKKHFNIWKRERPSPGQTQNVTSVLYHM